MQNSVGTRSNPKVLKIAAKKKEKAWGLHDLLVSGLHQRP